MNRNRLDQAIADVLKATDSFLGLTRPEIVTLRLDLDRWVRWAGTLGY